MVQIDLLPPAPPPAPQERLEVPGHSSKTHCIAARVAAITQMNDEEKVVENLFIVARNRNKARLRAHGIQDPVEDELSEDESLISIDSPAPSRPQTPPPRLDTLAAIGSALKALSPQSLINSILGKRQPEAEERYEDRVKRLKLASAPQIKRAPGEIMTLPHHPELLELEAARFYVPLSLFTNQGQLVLADKLSQVKTIRINSGRAGAWKQSYVDTENKLFEREDLLAQEVWSQAADEMVDWALEAKTDDIFHRRLGEHFAWLKYQLMQGREFTLIRDLDIRFRKEYRRRLFEFSAAVYSEELTRLSSIHTETRLSSELAALRAQIAHTRSAASEPPPSRPSVARFSQSFPTGQSRPPSDPVCLICSRRGHRAGDCAQSAFPDGTPTKSKWVDGQLIGAQRARLCIKWNSSGRVGSVCSPHRNPNTVHACSFCHSTSHHAFSYACLPRPPA